MVCERFAGTTGKSFQSRKAPPPPDPSARRRQPLGAVRSVARSLAARLKSTVVSSSPFDTPSTQKSQSRARASLLHEINGGSVKRSERVKKTARGGRSPPPLVSPLPAPLRRPRLCAKGKKTRGGGNERPSVTTRRQVKGWFVVASVEQARRGGAEARRPRKKKENGGTAAGAPLDSSLHLPPP